MPQVTIPELNNINRQAGSLVLTIDDTSTTTANLLKTGPFLLKKDATSFTLQTSATNTQKQLKVTSNTTGATTLIWTWIKNNHRLIVLNGTTVTQGIKENSALSEDFGLIDFVNPIVRVKGISQASKIPTVDSPATIRNLNKIFNLISKGKAVGTNPAPTLTQSITLANPLRSVGTITDEMYLDIDGKWKVSRKVGEYTFTGDEAMNTIIKETTTLFVGTASIGAVTKAADNLELLSTHFPVKGIYELDEEGVYLNPTGLFRLSINTARLSASNPAGLKTWLTGKGVKIQYQLAVPIVEILPTSEQDKLNLFLKRLVGNTLTATDGTLTTTSSAPLFTGSYRSLAIYSQDVLYNTASADLLTKLKNSGTVLFDADYTRPMHYAKKPYLEATMAPRDNSPILVNNEEGPMQRQYFFDHITGLYAETNTESFVYRGENELAVSYDKLDATYTVTVRFGAESIGEPVTVIDNRILLTMTPEQKEYWYGKTFDVTYRLASSYTVEYNEQAAHDSYLVRLENHQDQEVTITQEGNRFSNQRLMKEIELNPIVNPQHTGFMYISKEEQISQAFRLTLSSNYIIANGLDSADFIVEVIDQDGNEVLSPYVDVFIMNELGLVTSQFGSFTPIINKDTLKAKNAAGRSYYKYQAPLIRKGDTKKTQKVFAVAYDRKHKIGAQVPLILRPSEPVYDVTGTNYLKINLPLQTRSDASIVFEYFARYYEKPIPAGHPILLLDSDGDGVLTYTDLNQFLIEQTNAVRMQEIAYALRETEAF